MKFKKREDKGSNGRELQMQDDFAKIMKDSFVLERNT